MEALAALGVASSVVQFIHFISECISTGAEIGRSAGGASQQTLELEEVYRSLRDLSYRLRCEGNSRQKIEEQFVQLADHPQHDKLKLHIKALEGLTVECGLLCEQLLQAVEKLRVQGASCRSFKSFIAALKTVWNGKKIRDLEERIDRYQRMISLHFFPFLWYTDRTRFTLPLLMLRLSAISSHKCSEL